MVIRVEELKKEIEKRFKNYEEKEIEISGNTYRIYIPKDIESVFIRDEDINLFEGFLYAEIDSKEDLSNLINYSPISGYVGRVGIIIYRDEELILKEYREKRQIRKTIAKINDPFLKKLKKAIEEPTSENISALFSRSDVIEEFYVLYKKCREFLLKNVKGISEVDRREEFVDNFMMQMLTLWYLQEKGFFNKDRRYFITKFNELKQKKLFGGFESYYDFLRHFFEQISGYSDEPYVEDESIGKCIVIGPSVFLNGEDEQAITIPDKCFYQEGVTEKLINLTPKGRRRMISENDIDFDIPLLNLFESRDWVDGDIDEYVLGSIYEKLITYMERKKLGAFYTPEEITSYICKNTIEPYLVDRINEEFGKSYGSIDELINAGEKEELLKLFDLLKDIKILDPAVGSAHFLESAINVLLEIYRKLRDKAKEIGIEKLEILVADDGGRIKPLNLLEIPEKEGLFEVYVKFFIILSRNIYGVDINPSALKVARARLFLTLARHFNVNAGVFIRFPNVHFNLREGNSLIGYVDVPRGKKELKQVTLDFSFEHHEIEYIKERIKVDDELREYLPEIASALRIDGDIIRDVEEMNRILASKKIRWSEFEKVLKTKEKLIQILVASLNSRYAVKLNKLLKEITELFNRKLDEKFAEEYGIDLEDLRKIKTFHWVFEFPEVFLEKSGFDVVVGNPPYVRNENINDITPGIAYKEVLERLYDPYDTYFDFSMFFILRSVRITKKKGYHSFIITNKWLRATYGEKVRHYLKSNVTIKEIVDFGGKIKIFIGSTVDTMIYFIIKKKPQSDSKIIVKKPDSINELGKIGYYIRQNVLEGKSWSLIPEEENEIKKWIEKVGKPLKEWNIKIYYGIKTGLNEAFIINTEKRNEILSNCKDEEEKKRTEAIIKPIVRGRDIGRYYYEWAGLWVILAKFGFYKIARFYPAVVKHLLEFEEKLKNRGQCRYTRSKKSRNPDFEGQHHWLELDNNPKDEYLAEFEKEKIVWIELVDKGRFSLVGKGIYTEATTFLMISKEPKYLIGLLNSTIINWYFDKICAESGVGTNRWKKVYVEMLPIPLLSTNALAVKEIKTLVDYLLFLNADKKVRKDSKDFVEFLDRLILDSIIYELYFKDKFYQDGAYNKPIYYLTELVAKYLKPIDYDTYAKLAYSIEPLSEEEKQRMEKMKEEYLKTIKEVIEAIKADKEIMELIERIKQHEWVRMIERGV